MLFRLEQRIFKAALANSMTLSFLVCVKVIWFNKSILNSNSALLVACSISEFYVDTVNRLFSVFGK